MSLPRPLRHRFGLAVSVSSLALTLATAAFAQQAPSKMTLLDLIHPDRIAARFLQMGIAGLRTQADVVYGTLTTSVMGGTATITDLTIWPLVDWPMVDQCEITFDRLSLASAPLSDLDTLRFKMHVSGGMISADCLPPEAREPMLPILSPKMAIPRATIDVEYKIPSSSARLQLQLTVAEVAALSTVVDLDYVWLDATDTSRDPEPVVFLTSARMTLDNLGLWDKVQPMVPPMATDPAAFGAIIDQVVAQIAPSSPRKSPQRAELADSMKEAWSEFLADPRRLVLETSFTDGPRLLQIDAWDSDGPDAMLDDLELRMSTRSASLRALPPSDLLTKAYEAPESLSDDERLRIGSALATGAGAPRDVTKASELLLPLVEAGDGEAALLLAQAQEYRDPELAYRFALLAAEHAAPKAAGVLDRIEAALPLARVLELQHELTAEIEHPIDALDDLSSVRDEASKRLYGKGRSRSYEVALLWALIGAAAGDDESLTLLAEIDQIIANADPEARAVWAEQEAASAELARSAWTGFDLPTSFGASR